MIEFKINNELVEIASQVTYNRNRLERADFGRVTIKNTRSARYEPFTRAEFTSDGITEQYLVESDEPLRLKDTIWEHEITLIENIAIFSTIFPVDRQFTRVPALTIGEILEIYKNELEYYQNFIFDFDETDDLFDREVTNKEYTGQDLAAIVYDLFRTINAIPRLTWVNDKWVLSYELYTERGSALTISEENRQSSVNDIDYATELMTQTRNAINEDTTGIWFPSKTGSVTPRSVGTQLTTSELQYELDSDIAAIYEVEAIGVRVAVFNKDFNTVKYVDVDITDFVLSEEVYESLKDETPDTDEYTIKDYTTTATEDLSKQQTVSYKFDDNVIENLFTKRTFWGFGVNVNNILNAIRSAFDDTAKTTLKAEIEADNPEVVFQDNVWQYFFSGMTNTRDIKIRVRYRPKRDIAYITEKVNNTGFNKATIKNEQRNKSVELSKILESSSITVNRIGNEIINLTESFDTLSEAWELGDYINSNWLATNIQYQLDKTLVVVTADFTKNFANTDRGTSITREPSAYVYTGRSIVSNYIVREYLVLYNESTNQLDDSNLTTNNKNVIMNIFDYSATYNAPLKHISFKPTKPNLSPYLTGNQFIHMPVMAGGSGNSIVIHAGFRDARIAGNALQEISSSWYKKPVNYTSNDDFELDNATILLSNEINLLDDTDDLKYYPIIDSPDLTSLNYNNIPLDKDPNDIFALTWQLIVTSDDDDIVVPNGFAKFNNLIKEYDTAPVVKQYSSTTPYTIFDKEIKGTEMTNNVTLNVSEGYIEVTDSYGDAIEYWALAVDGETILAGNNSITRVNFLFSKHRRYALEVNDFTSSPELDISISFTEDISTFENYNISPELDLTITVNEDLSRLYYVYNTVQPTIELDVNVTEQTIQVKYIYNTVQPTLTLTTNVTEQSLQQENIVHTVQPTITLETSVAEQTVLQEVIEVTIQPTITLETNVVEQSLQQVDIVNTVQPTLNLNVNYIQNIMTNLKAWDYLGSGTTSDEYSYVDTVSEVSNPSLDPELEAKNYDIDDIIRADDGTLPATYHWWQVVYKY